MKKLNKNISSLPSLWLENPSLPIFANRYPQAEKTK